MTSPYWSEVLLPLLQVWTTTALLGLLFLVAGDGLVAAAFGDEGSPARPFRSGAAFFLGLFLYLFLFRTATFAFGSAAAACYGAVGLLALIAGGRLRRVGTAAWRGAAPIGLLFLAFTSLAVLLRLPPEAPLKVLTSFGSLHAGRYANIALYIVDENQVPRLNQNYGQSMLAAAHGFFGSRAPLAALASWLALSGGALAWMLFGAFRSFGLSARGAAAGAFFVLFANTALSLQCVLVIDSGSPLALTGYTDVMAALATWLIVPFWLHACAARSTLRPADLILAGLLPFVWAWTAPQNILIGLGVLAWFGVADYVPRLRLAGMTAVFLAGTALGACLGGMFMPPGWATLTDLPEMMSPHQSYYAGAAASGILPDQPFAVWRPDGAKWWFQLFDSRFPDETFLLETKIWLTLRIFFFPIVGLVGLAALQWRREAADRALLSRWLLTGAVALFAGIMATFWFLYHGFKWELTRFLLPGVITGLVAMIWFLHEASLGLSPRVRRGLWAAVLVVGMYGPMERLAVAAYQNHAGPGGAAVPMSKRLELLTTPNRIIHYKPEDPS